MQTMFYNTYIIYFFIITFQYNVVSSYNLLHNNYLIFLLLFIIVQLFWYFVTACTLGSSRDIDCLIVA